MMRVRRGRLTGAAIGALALAASSLALLLDPGAPAGAQASRTWVSGVGDDVNPCNRTAPCKTFAGAISKTASGGEINVLDPSGYGAVTITKSITIDGGGLLASILASGTNGVTVNAGANDVVVLRGLTISGDGTGLNGVRFLAGKALVVEDTSIERFRGGTGHGIDVRPTIAGQVLVSNSVIRNNTGAAIFAKGTAPASLVVSDSRLQNNGAGIDVQDNASVTIRGGAVTGNSGPGLQARPDAGDAELNVDHVLVAFNGTGIQSGGNGRAATVRLSNATVVNNTTGIAKQDPAVVLSGGRNQLVGNTANGTFNAELGTPLPPPPPSAVACSPRPPVTVHVSPSRAGQLEVTVTAATNPGGSSATNTVQEVRFGAAHNATLSGAGIPAGSTGRVNVALAANASTSTFTVQRSTPGQAFTVPLTVRDACGDWPTFVGAGAGTP